MVEKPYVLPDPRTRPDAFLVCVYKVLKKIEYDDRAWDKVYFARCVKRTGQLLENLDGDVRAAAKCMQNLRDQFEAEDTKWTIETICAYSFEWKADQVRKTNHDTMQRFLGDFSKDPRVGELKRADAVGLIEKLRSLPQPPRELEPGEVRPTKVERE